ncbi:MAG: hypothetical protein AAF413_03020 [Patescibacteria group bacterium]
MSKSLLVRASIPESARNVAGAIDMWPAGHQFHKDDPVIDGFTEIEGAIGTGSAGFNTGRSSRQLVVALALLAELDDKMLKGDHNKVVARLRQSKVLGGKRILDANYSVQPTFAVAAAALGAEVYLLKGAISQPAYDSKVTRVHELDIRATDVSGSAFPSNFDLAVTGSVEPGLGMTLLGEAPRASSISALAIHSLRPGGYVYNAKTLRQKQTS